VLIFAKAKKKFGYVRRWVSAIYIDIILEITVWRMTSELKYFDILRHSAVDCYYSCCFGELEGNRVLILKTTSLPFTFPFVKLMIYTLKSTYNTLFGPHKQIYIYLSSILLVVLDWDYNTLKNTITNAWHLKR